MSGVVRLADRLVRCVERIVTCGVARSRLHTRATENWDTTVLCFGIIAEQMEHRPKDYRGRWKACLDCNRMQWMCYVVDSELA